MAKDKGKGKGKEKLNKEEIAEDWCFECYDGGELIICDYEECLKAYHPECVRKKNSILTSDKRWICGWHRCLECKKSSKYHCYCCQRAVCSRCIGRIAFVSLKGEFGFCNNCLRLALLVEEDKNVDSDGESVDFRDRDTHEGLFREYYEIIKEKEGFDKNSLLAAKARLDKEKNIFHINSDSDEYIEEKDESSEEEDEQLASDNGDLNDEDPHKKGLKRKKCTHQKTKVKSKKREFFGWGSKSLIEFLQYIGQDTREKLSQYAVSSLITKYAQEHHLIHPVKKRRIVCDIHLLAIFGKKEVSRLHIHNLLESHYVENVEQLEEEESDHDVEDNETEMLTCEREKKPEQNNLSLIKHSTPEQNNVSSIKHSTQFAALIPQNIKLVYLKRSLLLKMIKQTRSIETKIIGSFVRVKLDPSDHKRSSSHQLAQIEGIRHGSSNNSDSEIFLQVSNMSRDVPVSILSDAEISEEECDDLKGRVKAGLLKKLTIVELKQKAKILHEDIVKHAIEQEVVRLQNKIDWSNEKSRRKELDQHLYRKQFIQHPSYLSFQLQNIPAVVPEEVELEPLVKDKKDGNQTRQFSADTILTEQNVPRVNLEEVMLEPLPKDSDGNRTHQCTDETTLTKLNVPRVNPEEVKLDRLAKDRDENQMHQCTDETTLTKKNVPRVNPEEVKLDPLAKDRDGNRTHQRTNETTLTKQNVTRVTPVALELEVLAKDERIDNQMQRCSDEALFPELSLIK